MKIIVDEHKIKIVKNPVNEKEINISKCEFEFAEAITEEYVKEAFFTLNGKTYKQEIINNECSIPYEVLEEKGEVEIGVVAYLLDNDEYEKRYNPEPDYIDTLYGSLKEQYENSEEVTPTDKEQMEQALQNGLNDISEAIDSASNLDIDANKVGTTTTITITKQDSSTKEVEINDGQDGRDGIDGSDGVGLDYNWNGTSLGIKREDEENYSYTNLKGDKGDKGDPGAIQMIIVNELPLVGDSETLYFVPKQDTEARNLYDEYVYINGAWELLGEKQIDIDLSDYYTKQETNSLLNDKANTTDIPTTTSDLNNDSGFITNSTNNLLNYYKKSETYTKEEVNDLISEIGGSNEVSGSIINITDALNKPLIACEVGIEPIQEGSGDPSPSNVRPITGWSEINLNVAVTNIWDEDWEVGTININTGAEVEDNTRIRNKGYIAVKENTTYHFTVPVNDGRIVFYKADKTYLSSMPGSTIFSNKYFTSPSGAYYVRFSPISAYGTTYNNDISINYPSTDTDYHAYNGNTYNIEFPSEAGTVYGGTLDVTNGVLTVDRVMVDLGSLNWDKVAGQNKFFVSNFNNAVKFHILGGTNRNVPENFVCSAYKLIGGQDAYDCIYDLTIGGSFFNGTNYLLVNNSNYSTATDFKAGVQGVKLVYEVATPTTYNLTPTEIETLLGTNNIFADSGDTDVIYIRDTKLFLNQLDARVKALENE